MQQRIAKSLCITLSVAAALAFTEAAIAQSEGGSKTTFFSMFFTSSDAIGWIIIWVLILMSVAVMAMIIQGIMTHRTKAIMPPETILVYEQLLGEKRYSEAIERASTDPTPFGKTIHASLSEASNGYGAMARAIEEQTDLLTAERVRSLAWLDVMGAVGPMLGLFGTVYGMILAFQEIVNVGGQPKPADLAAGISTALVTTVWGLVVGIPAVAAAALFRTHIDGAMVSSMVRAEELISRFKPAKKSSTSKPSAAPRPKPAAAT